MPHFAGAGAGYGWSARDAAPEGRAVVTGGGPPLSPGAPAQLAARVGRSALTMVLADLTAALPALEDAEQFRLCLSAMQCARFADLASRGTPNVRVWRGAHIALRIVLERQAGPAVRGLDYIIERGGRPRLPVSAALEHPPHFSLSHTGSIETGALALIAVAGAHPVGVDLECPRIIQIAPERRQRIEDAARRLAPDTALPDAPDDRLLQAWVRLEATAKATGEGVGRLLSRAGVFGAGFASQDAHHASREPLASVAVRDLQLYDLQLRDLQLRDLQLRDLQLGERRFAAIAARALPAVLQVEDLPSDMAGLAAF